jgi:hypothetical protein
MKAARRRKSRCDPRNGQRNNPMTQMSDPRFVSTTARRANCATREVRDRLARPLHIRWAIRILLAAMLFTGCVIPPSLSVDTTDAGLNAAPSIISVRADGVELPEWSTVQFEQGSGTLNLIVYDTDLDDTLYPKVFVNYVLNDPTPPRSTCTQAAGRTVMRSSTCDLTGLCQVADASSNETLTMQVLVFDRQVIEGQVPIYQAMPAGGLSTSRTFFLKCLPKS